MFRPLVKGGRLLMGKKAKAASGASPLHIEAGLGIVVGDPLDAGERFAVGLDG